MSLNKLNDPEIFDVDLNDVPSRRWRSAAEQIGESVCSITQDVVDFCDEYLECLPRWLSPIAKLATHGAASLTGRVVGTVASLYRQEYSTEIKSIAKIAGVSYPQLLLGNVMYDLSQWYDYRFGGEASFPAACSSFSCNLPGGIPVLARNMDWAIPESLGSHTVVIRFHRGRRSYLSVGVAGMVGVLSAMYPNHWAVTLNQAPVAQLGVRLAQTPALQRLRHACDQFGGYRKLVQHIQEYQSMSPFFAHVVGRKADQHCVINGCGDGYWVREKDGDCLIQTNHFVDEEWDHLNGPDEWEEDGVVWTWDSKPRYRSLKRRLRRLPETVTEAMTKLKRSPVTNENTMQQMAFCPGLGEWRLRVAS
jgi:hypothetical protein